MKKQFFSFLTLFLFLNIPYYLSAKTTPKLPASETIVIGHVNNGIPSFIVDANQLMSDLSTFISTNQQAPVTFTKISIFSNPGSSSYYLLAIGTKGSDIIRTTVFIHQDVQCLYVGGESLTTCTTNDCANESNGCVPVLTACTLCSNNGICSKTVSGSPRAVFTSFSLSSCQ